jgi:hypothetical protein
MSVQSLRKFLGGQSIHHVPGRQPSTPGRYHSIRHVLQMLGMMRIGGNGELTAFCLCRPKQRPINVKTLRAGVDLKPNSPSRRFGRNFLEIELLPFAVKQ